MPEAEHCETGLGASMHAAWALPFAMPVRLFVCEPLSSTPGSLEARLGVRVVLRSKLAYFIRGGPAPGAKATDKREEKRAVLLPARCARTPNTV